MQYALQPLLLPLALLGALVGLEEEGKTGALDWPQWRGPSRDGQVLPAGDAVWPADLSPEHLTEAWRVEQLGPSYSGPILDGKHVYTTETINEEYEVVRALDRFTGREVWRVSWEGAMEVPFFAARNGSWIRSTPAVDESSLYVVGMQDVLQCLNTETGEVRWTVDFRERFEVPQPDFGAVCSPLIDGDFLYLQAGASLVKLDKHTGETLWRSMVDAGDIMSGGSFSSPVLAELAGERQLVVQSRTDLAGVDLEDGSVLWSTPIKAFRGMNILTPTVVGEAVFTSAYGGRSHLFAVERDGEDLVATEIWDGALQGYMTSPVVVDGHAYLFTKSNRFGCVELESGEERWTSPPTGDSYWSLAAQGNRILSLSDTGSLRLIEASPEGFSVLSEREVLEEETWAHVAPAGDHIFVRGQSSLIALEWK